jgi:hypothetical protein
MDLLLLIQHSGNRAMDKLEYCRLPVIDGAVSKQFKF